MRYFGLETSGEWSDDGIWMFTSLDYALKIADKEPWTIVFEADIKDVWPELEGVEL